MAIVLGLVELVVLGAIVTLVVLAITRSRMVKPEAQRTDAALGEQAGELKRLRDRVEVLEKLATDEDRALAKDIERLRGPDAGRGAGPRED
jgi:hypothetical protein